MHIGVITVRNSKYHPNKRLAEACSEQGHQMTLVHPSRVWPTYENGKLGLAGTPNLETLDVVLPRQGATIGDSRLPLIRQFALMGLPIVNGMESIFLAKNQSLSLQALSSAGLVVPDTEFVSTGEGFEEAVDRMGGYPVVAKQVSGRQGKGVMLVENLGEARSVVSEHLAESRGLLVQRFIPPVGRRDIRVFVLGERVIGAMELRPKEGDFRANFHLSETSESVRLSSSIEKLAIEASKALGLEIAGVDLIVDQKGKVNVIEVNYSPGFKGLEDATGLDIAGLIVRYLATVYGKENASPKDEQR